MTVEVAAVEDDGPDECDGEGLAGCGRQSIERPDEVEVEKSSGMRK
jgi:hypothetical protein